jgi:hypothetical protein
MPPKATKHLDPQQPLLLMTRDECVAIISRAKNMSQRAVAKSYKKTESQSIVDQMRIDAYNIQVEQQSEAKDIQTDAQSDLKLATMKARNYEDYVEQGERNEMLASHLKGKNEESARQKVFKGWTKATQNKIEKAIEDGKQNPHQIVKYQPNIIRTIRDLKRESKSLSPQRPTAPTTSAFLDAVPSPQERRRTADALTRIEVEDERRLFEYMEKVAKERKERKKAGQAIEELELEPPEQKDPKAVMVQKSSNKPHTRKVGIDRELAKHELQNDAKERDTLESLLKDDLHNKKFDTKVQDSVPITKKMTHSAGIESNLKQSLTALRAMRNTKSNKSSLKVNHNFAGALKTYNKKSHSII